jgi:hypothetical protein
MSKPPETEKLRAFKILVSENPSGDLVELAQIAGYVNPRQFVERLKSAEARAAQEEKEEKEERRQGLTPDRAKALRALRRIATSGTDNAKVQAAKALLESEPKPLTANSQILVVFRGVELDPRQELIADVDPAALAAAIEHVKAEREAAHEQQIQDHAHKYAIDPDEMQLAWELWQHQEARAAGLRVLVLSDATPPTNYSRANLDCQVKSVVGQQSPILTGQVEQLVALESEVTTISTDSQLSP